MQVEYRTEELRRLAIEPGYTMGLPQQVATTFRRRVQFMIAAGDERALYAMQGSLDYKKLKGEDGVKSMRLNQQYRIHLEVFIRDGSNSIRILNVGDFHD